MRGSICCIKEALQFPALPARRIPAKALNCPSEQLFAKSRSRLQRAWRKIRRRSDPAFPRISAANRQNQRAIAQTLRRRSPARTRNRASCPYMGGASHEENAVSGCAAQNLPRPCCPAGNARRDGENLSIAHRNAAFARIVIETNARRRPSEQRTRRCAR